MGDFLQASAAVADLPSTVRSGMEWLARREAALTW